MALLVSQQVTTSELFRALLLYVGEFPPTGLPFNFQLYTGAGPPLVIAAVKVTAVPAQTLLPGFAVIATVGLTVVMTVMVTVLLATTKGLAHEALLVMLQVITSLLASVLSI